MWESAVRGLIGCIVFAVGGRAVFSMGCLVLIGCRLFLGGFVWCWELGGMGLFFRGVCGERIVSCFD